MHLEAGARRRLTLHGMNINQLTGRTTCFIRADERHGGLASVGAVGVSGRGPNSQQRQRQRALQPTSNSLQVGVCVCAPAWC